ncbi:class I SAM-dependent methyltransferase [Streptomyces lincolnensis]|uniref:class I SAM-dependent methyltransferase n=1 Tax=Streptomyces lincolnensis TaxID=1915 RepID=UPI001E548990|nr:class I SAM-dependent methyltransferase [Streptomyces lincolnensis]MCD7444574.1 class I SAM-dependent methyltransferase [Streptomyces lincolnensis]
MLRETFDEVAELYDRVRPRYPDALVRDLARVAGLGPDSQVLEVAPGTGQLTVPLAGFGCRVTAVELGPAMAAVARRRLRRFPLVDVEVADFERWPLPDEPFDLVVCATAFHWLDPVVRVTKTAQTLRPGGRLAVVTTDHVAGGTTEFFHRSQPYYRRWDPATPPGLMLRDESEVHADTGDLERAEAFRDVAVTRYFQDVTYTADEYIDVLLTYSGHRALDDGARHGLLGDLRGLIESDFGGTVTKRYLHEVIVATRG